MALTKEKAHEQARKLPWFGHAYSLAENETASNKEQREALDVEIVQTLRDKKAQRDLAMSLATAQDKLLSVVVLFLESSTRKRKHDLQMAASEATSWHNAIVKMGLLDKRLRELNARFEQKRCEFIRDAYAIAAGDTWEEALRQLKMYSS